MSFFALFPSRTIAGALTLIPLLSRAFDLQIDNVDDWVWERLPKWFKGSRTFEKFSNLVKTGQDFIKAVWEYFHD